MLHKLKLVQRFRTQHKFLMHKMVYLGWDYPLKNKQKNVLSYVEKSLKSYVRREDSFTTDSVICCHLLLELLVL